MAPLGMHTTRYVVRCSEGGYLDRGGGHTKRRALLSSHSEAKQAIQWHGSRPRYGAARACSAVFEIKEVRRDAPSDAALLTYFATGGVVSSCAGEFDHDTAVIQEAADRLVSDGKLVREETKLGYGDFTRVEYRAAAPPLPNIFADTAVGRTVRWLMLQKSPVAQVDVLSVWYGSDARVARKECGNGSGPQIPASLYKREDLFRRALPVGKKKGFLWTYVGPRGAEWLAKLSTRELDAARGWLEHQMLKEECAPERAAEMSWWLQEMRKVGA